MIRGKAEPRRPLERQVHRSWPVLRACLRFQHRSMEKSSSLSQKRWLYIKTCSKTRPMYSDERNDPQKAQRLRSLLQKSREGNPKLFLTQLLRSDSHLPQSQRAGSLIPTSQNGRGKCSDSKEKCYMGRWIWPMVPHRGPDLLQQRGQESNTEFSCPIHTTPWMMDIWELPHPTRVASLVWVNSVSW